MKIQRLFITKDEIIGGKLLLLFCWSESFRGKFVRNNSTDIISRFEVHIGVTEENVFWVDAV
jgi:hypothetical protein